MKTTFTNKTCNILVYWSWIWGNQKESHLHFHFHSGREQIWSRTWLKRLR